jgi:uncharacterized protein DUF4261
MYEVLLLLERADEDAAAVGDVVPAPTRKQLAATIGHTRDWPGAADATSRARAAVRIVDELPSQERLPALIARVAAAAARLPCLAIWWTPAERLIEPRALAAAARDGDALRVALNTRLFHVETGRDDERVVDTVGLTALGLPDVQCHFRALDAAAVAELCDETARYLFAEGDVIADGDTVSGVDGTPWSCRREAALVDPPRDVIDITPPPANQIRER